MDDCCDFQHVPCCGKNLPRLLQPVLMAYLARGTAYGYRLMEFLKQEPVFRGDPPDPGGMYRILQSMEREGLVTCVWDTQGKGPARKQYSLTPRGKRCLRRWLQSLRTYHAMLGDVLHLLQDCVADGPHPARQAENAAPAGYCCG